MSASDSLVFGATFSAHAIGDVGRGRQITFLGCIDKHSCLGLRRRVLQDELAILPCATAADRKLCLRCTWTPVSASIAEYTRGPCHFGQVFLFIRKKLR